jgi:hypothetical protein
MRRYRRRSWRRRRHERLKQIAVVVLAVVAGLLAAHMVPVPDKAEQALLRANGNACVAHIECEHARLVVSPTGASELQEVTEP